MWGTAPSACPGLDEVGQERRGEPRERRAPVSQRNAEHSPDIALVDTQMPVLDGIEATGQIVADERLEEVHVVILTPRAG
jgi:CheY-like chemotaxis protein